jgi:hypothetical protein
MRRLFALGLAVYAIMTMDDDGPGASGPINYVVDPAQPYGPKWGRTRPPRLPAGTRRTADRASSVRMLAAALAKYPDQEFARVVAGLAQTESSTRVGRPANQYDGGNIRAYGLFSWNTLATPSSRVRIPGAVVTVGWRTVNDPVKWSTDEEINNPLKTYWTIWRGIRERGGNAAAAARGIRLWHRRPSLYRKFLSDGLAHGWASAWSRVESSHASVINRHLAGIV